MRPARGSFADPLLVISCLRHGKKAVSRPALASAKPAFFYPAAVDNYVKIVDNLTAHVETLPRSAGNIRIYADIAIFYPPYLGETWENSDSPRACHLWKNPPKLWITSANLVDNHLRILWKTDLSMAKPALARGKHSARGGKPSTTRGKNTASLWINWRLSVDNW
ncbi:hypothetical protein ADN00_01530 [Ornatilinea apprima]|uniref:Uncharacterized protein n=1 Tax=Ornatilinea apprima TaxID=1134406 RepID=A0A0P6XKM9_9CHLR|nr:hypothetical protein ADN00_01530 [Ornatilinea apprima]